MYNVLCVRSAESTTPTTRTVAELAPLGGDRMSTKPAALAAKKVAMHVVRISRTIVDPGRRHVKRAMSLVAHDRLTEISVLRHFAAVSACRRRAAAATLTRDRL